MRQEQATGWRFAAAFALAVLALVGTVGASKFGVPSAALADEDPDYLVLNPEHE